MHKLISFENEPFCLFHVSGSKASQKREKKCTLHCVKVIVKSAG